MRSERGSTTIMAITAMLVLAAGSASYAYVTNRNVDIATQYANGLQAQYSSEAAVRTAYVAGLESIKKTNGWQDGEKSALADWLDKTVMINLPNTMGLNEVKVSYATGSTTKYYVQALSSVKGAVRMAYNADIDLNNPKIMEETITEFTIAKLISEAKNKVGQIWGPTNWILPNNLDDTTSPAKSPGSGTNNEWSSVSCQILFTDGLGLSNFLPKDSLQLVFRVNYYIKLTNVPSGASSGSGYGIYYLAKKTSTSGVSIAGDPTSYIVQYDPGLHQGYGSPPGGNAWGAAFGGNDPNWPYGAFLVKKVWSDGKIGAQNEVWDEGSSYNDHCAFQDNNELTQRYYNQNGNMLPTLSSTNLVSTRYSSSWALQPPSTELLKSMPTVTQSPTAFGFNQNGNLLPELTGNYRQRPPDLRIAYTLGNIAEGNPWQKNTYYPQGSKVAVGAWVSDALNNRLVWEATTAGVSNTSKPPQMSLVPLVGTTVKDGAVTWTVKAAPTPEAIAKSILNYTLSSNRLSIAKISMSDLNFRVDSVNGTKKDQANPYSIPFAMIQGNKNKITIELWADNQGNRVHVIRVNDVLVLGFNDRAGKTYDIIPAKWELNPTLDSRSTGIKIWNAAAEFYTSENYGQTMTYKPTSNYGIWGK
jgi:hypothetical protein